MEIGREERKEELEAMSNKTIKEEEGEATGNKNIKNSQFHDDNDDDDDSNIVDGNATCVTFIYKKPREVSQLDPVVSVPRNVFRK